MRFSSGLNSTTILKFGQYTPFSDKRHHFTLKLLKTSSGCPTFRKNAVIDKTVLCNTEVLLKSTKKVSLEALKQISKGQYSKQSVSHVYLKLLLVKL